jgi:hypothetical protein
MPLSNTLKYFVKIFSIEIRLDCIARSLSAILGETKSALCDLAWSHDSVLCCIARSQLTEL